MVEEGPVLYREIRVRVPTEQFPPFDRMSEDDFPGFFENCVGNYAVNNHEVWLYIKTMDNYLTLPLEEMKK